jgi:hypothetical protein
MGFSIYTSLHYKVPKESILEFYRIELIKSDRDYKIQERIPPHNLRKAIILHQPVNNWTIIQYQDPESFKKHHHINLNLSKMYRSTLLFIWAYDGDYWAYELFQSGEFKDQFCLDPRAAIELSGWNISQNGWKGNSAILANHLTGISTERLHPYLVQRPDVANYQDSELHIKDLNRLDVKVNPGDKYTRFDELAVLNFFDILRIPFQDISEMKVWKVIEC